MSTLDRLCIQVYIIVINCIIIITVILMDEFYTINQVAVILKVHPLTVRRYVKEGKLKAYRAGGNVRISVYDLKNFTQSFITHHMRQNKLPISSPARSFSFSDPILSLKGKGLNISKLRQEEK